MTFTVVVKRKVTATKPSVRLFFILSLLSFILLNCSRQLQNRQRIPAVYYWQTSFFLSAYDKAVLDSLRIRKMYVRFFDVDWNPNMKSPQAVSPVKVQMSAPDSIEIIPTVFLTNRTMINISKEMIALLADDIIHKIALLASQLQLESVREVQLDCDWTERSRGNYFDLLSQMKKKLGRTKTSLSVTLRLHQMALPKQTGIPPAERAVLMFYNMGDLRNPTGQSSILDVDIGRQYLNASKPYPLPLDVALPMYQWCVVLRGENVVHLIQNFTGDVFSDTVRYNRIAANRFRVKRSHYSHQCYFYKGDIVRIERASLEDLHQSAALLRENNIVSDQASVIFFHYDSLQYQRYGYENLRRLYNSFN